ncbi:GTP-binding protein A [Mycena venus]|uniref:GTP-binding protein A n=1 Tax=Mycena venus TaxID=2733690 RepID=A0A8H6X974_9AGAR|nr:GTP-binding protein A [Mycena venus]
MIIKCAHDVSKSIRVPFPEPVGLSSASNVIQVVDLTETQYQVLILRFLYRDVMGQIPGGTTTGASAPNLEASSSRINAIEVLILAQFLPSMATAVATHFAPASAHSYQPFYLPRGDTEVLISARFLPSMATTVATNFAPATAHSYQPFYLPRGTTLPASDSLVEAAKRQYFMAVSQAANGDGANDSEDSGSKMSCGSSPRDSSVHDALPQEDEVAIAIMGPTGSGKTSFINLLSGSNLLVGRGLQSCTSAVQVASPFQLDGRWITLIDTPGFDDTSKSDTEVLTQIAAFLATAYESEKMLAGVIYMHRISDVRMGGISTRNFKMFRQLCGESTLKNVVIVTNFWGEVGREVGEAREAELVSDDRFLKPVLDKGAHMLRHDNDVTSAQAILHYLIANQPRALRIQRELVDQGKDISQTAAGEELNRELAEQIKRHREEMAILQREMKEAIRAKDEETKRELELETRKLQTEMTRVQDDSKKMASDYTEQKGRAGEEDG